MFAEGQQQMAEHRALCPLSLHVKKSCQSAPAEQES